MSNTECSQAFGEILCYVINPKCENGTKKNLCRDALFGKNRIFYIWAYTNIISIQTCNVERVI